MPMSSETLLCVFASWLFPVCPLFQSPLPPTRSSGPDSFTCLVSCRRNPLHGVMDAGLIEHPVSVCGVDAHPLPMTSPIIARCLKVLPSTLQGGKNSSPSAWLSLTASGRRVLPLSHTLCSNHSKLLLLSKQMCPFTSLLWTRCSFC